MSQKNQIHSQPSKVLLFDIDATLLLSGQAGLRALDQTFYELYGIEKAMKDIRPDGKTDPLIIREVLEGKLAHVSPDAEIPRVARIYLDHLKTEVEHSPGFHLMPGTRELLDALSRIDSLALGLATGNLEQAAWIKLRRGGLDAYFRFGGFGSDAENRTELIRVAILRAEGFLDREVPRDSVFVIGDTPRDILHAKEAGVKTVAVATGRSNMEELSRYTPDYLLADFSRTRDVIQIFCDG
jgi:phosphoglycolate phosphatase